MIVLAALFFVVAIIYASVGFGGGSTYTALLAIAETDYRILPVVSLTCNIIVVTGGVIQFARAGAIDWMRTLPICALSIPLAWLGGRIVISEIFFTGLWRFPFSLLASCCSSTVSCRLWVRNKQITRLAQKA